MKIKNIELLLGLMVDKVLTIELKVLTWESYKIHRLELKRINIQRTNNSKVEAYKAKLERKIDKLDKKIWKLIKSKAEKENRMSKK